MSYLLDKFGYIPVHVLVHILDFVIGELLIAFPSCLPSPISQINLFFFLLVSPCSCACQLMNYLLLFQVAYTLR